MSNVPELLNVMIYSFSFTQVSETEVITHKATFDITIDGEKLGRVVIGLFGKVVPKTVQNFVYLASDRDKKHTYKGAKFHKVVRDFLIQGKTL